MVGASLVVEFKSHNVLHDFVMDCKGVGLRLTGSAKQEPHLSEFVCIGYMLQGQQAFQELATMFAERRVLPRSNGSWYLDSLMLDDNPLQMMPPQCAIISSNWSYGTCYLEPQAPGLVRCYLRSLLSNFLKTF